MTTSLHPVVVAVTARVQQRSAVTRAAYCAKVAAIQHEAAGRAVLSVTNLAHVFAAAPAADKILLKAVRAPNLAIITAYNDMLSAHQPFSTYPDWIKQAARAVGATAQVAGGVPAMCDGVTQGRPGMELSLFSRDVIALATGIALAHESFDAVLCLGVCDKIVPGLLMGALAFGHLPAIFVPAGPMPSGDSNEAKARVRQRHAAGQATDAELLESEGRSYHAPGTCTFYGTANSNQMLMEVMGLHLPGAAFVAPGTPLREALTRAAAKRAVAISHQGREYTPLAQVIDVPTIVNGIVGLLATGGSTNHTIHLVAIARMAGILIDWDDFSELSAVVPLLARVYPNGTADVNAFHAAGGTALLIHELLGVGLLHEDVVTAAGRGLTAYTQVPALEQGELVWRPVAVSSQNPTVLAGTSQPFAVDGGLKLLRGNLGRAVIKVSAVKPEHRRVCAPARVFDSQEALLAAYRAGQLGGDMVAVVRGQGPRANGMPELHKLTPTLANLQDQGFQVALVTDGRMSGASGKVPAAIHVTPEAMVGGPLSRVRDGDRLLVDAEQGILEAQVPESEWSNRAPVQLDLSGNIVGVGRELFGLFRTHAGGAEEGAMSFALLT